ncbi:MAG: P-loop NTPase, partial [Candidatus Thermoplasmatota archaeon]
RGHDITNIIIELLAITRWDKLDYLIIDMPPGIGDEILDVIRFIPKSEFVVVSTPSKVAMGSVKKLLEILKEIKVPILGVIENMKMERSDFVQNKVEKNDFCFLGSIGFDKNLEKSIGKPDKIMESDFMKDLDLIINKIV